MPLRTWTCKPNFRKSIPTWLDLSQWAALWKECCANKVRKTWGGDYVVEVVVRFTKKIRGSNFPHLRNDHRRRWEPIRIIVRKKRLKSDITSTSGTNGRIVFGVGNISMSKHLLPEPAEVQLSSRYLNTNYSFLRVSTWSTWLYVEFRSGYMHKYEVIRYLNPIDI